MHGEEPNLSKVNSVKYIVISWAIPDWTGDRTVHVGLEQNSRKMAVVVQVVIACSRRQWLSFCLSTLLPQNISSTKQFNVSTNTIHEEVYHVYEVFPLRKTLNKAGKARAAWWPIWDSADPPVTVYTYIPTWESTHPPGTGQIHVGPYNPPGTPDRTELFEIVKTHFCNRHAWNI